MATQFPVPVRPPLPGPEPDHPRLGQHPAADVCQQARAGLVIRPVSRTEHHAVANPVLQRDAPLPPRLARNGAGVGFRRFHGFGLHGNGAVARQPVSEVLVPDVERLFDQEAPEPRAVDEQVACDALPGLQSEGRDEAALRILLHAFDAAFLAHRTVLLGHAAQERRVERRVEVIRVVEPPVRQHGETVLPGGRPLLAVLAELPADPPLPALEPEVLEARRPTVLPGPAERVDVVTAEVAPASRTRCRA